MELDFPGFDVIFQIFVLFNPTSFLRLFEALRFFYMPKNPGIRNKLQNQTTRHVSVFVHVNTNCMYTYVT